MATIHVAGLMAVPSASPSLTKSTSTLSVTSSSPDQPHPEPEADTIAITITTSDSSATATAASPPATSTCQICLDDVPMESDDGVALSPSPVVTAFCGSSCRALVCTSCLQQHLTVVVSAAFPGVLPKVCCPICLTRVNKSRWERFATQATQARYEDVCRMACSFRAPCCDDAFYSHLPDGLDSEGQSDGNLVPDALQLVPSLKAQIPDLRRVVRRFANHRLATSAVIDFIETTFGRPTPDTSNEEEIDRARERQHLVVQHVLVRILDEERRATLLLAYAARYRAIQTYCCGSQVCFNCKRCMEDEDGNEHDPETCEDDECIDADCIVECRACRVTMVKVEGCADVVCWCGFRMDWDTELWVRDRHLRGLIPVDVFDRDRYDQWTAHKTEVLAILANALPTRLMQMQQDRLDRHLAPYRQNLRAILQRYLWRRRFSRSLPMLQSGLAQAHALTRLRGTPFGVR